MLENEVLRKILRPKMEKEKVTEGWKNLTMRGFIFIGLLFTKYVHVASIGDMRNMCTR
jgi:hypothetical protein